MDNAVFNSSHSLCWLIMATTLYVGLPRSGKSYEVVSNVILASIEQGRSVISNIAGLDQQAMYDFLIAEGRDPSSFGRLITVTEEQILSEDFWLTDKDDTQEQQEKKFIKAGMLLALDEIWRFFPTDQKVPKYVLNFFRMHGHFVNQENGLTCEIALISQAVIDLHRQIKATVMTTILMEKCTDLGIDSMYTVKIYSKTKCTGKPLNSYGPLKYNPKYFPLYTSNSKNQSGIKPREIRTEKRNSIWKSKLMVLGMPLAFVMLFGGVYGASKFFNPETHKLKVSDNANDSQAPKSQEVQTVQSVAVVPNQSVNSQPSRVWRVSGLFGVPPNEKALLVNSIGQSRIVIPKTVSRYAEIISITTYPENAHFDSEPLPQNVGAF